MKLVFALCALVSAQSALAADNPLSQADLLSITQKSLETYAAANPMLANKITGFKVSTVGQDGKVVIYVNHDGMAMQGTYTCIRQTDSSFACAGQ